jgi:hypothetical protein
MVARMDPRAVAEILTLHEKVRRSYSRCINWQLTCVAYQINPEVFPLPQEHRRPPVSHVVNMYRMACRLAEKLYLPMPVSAALYEIGKLLLTAETKLLNIPEADTEEIDFV